jgi:hypothetical protein
MKLGHTSIFGPDSHQPYNNWLRWDLSSTFYPLFCVLLFCEVHIWNSMNLTYTCVFCQDSLFRIPSTVWTLYVLRHLCWPMTEKQWNLRYCKLWKLNCNFVKWSWKLPHMIVMCEVTTHCWLHQLFIATTFTRKVALFMLEIFTYDYKVPCCHNVSSVSMLWLYCYCSL